MPSFLENYTTIRQALFKKSYFLLYLNKATGYVPLEYNDEVKCLVAALHMSGLGGKGDELNHFLHITNALANGFDPKNLPKLYKDEIEKASDDKKFSIFEKCQNTLHQDTIFDLLYPKVNNTPENNYSATGNPDAGNLAAASYDIESSGDTSDNWDWLTH